MNNLLVINAGSSTIKWKLFNLENLEDLAEGVADRIGIDGKLVTKFNGTAKEEETTLENHIDAIKAIEKILIKYNLISDHNAIKIIGHRIVHGGSVFNKSIKIDKKSLAIIEDLSSLAPLHNPNAIRVVKAVTKIWPTAIQTATFDTAYHTTIPSINSTYPINLKLAQELKIKKYGFHGTSHRYVTEILEKELNQKSVTFISAHIGNGASLCAVKNSKSFDTTMGLTPLAGLMMGTRCGDIDPSIPKFISDAKGLSFEQINHILNKESGLKGVSGLSPDLRDIEDAIKNKNEKALFAYELYVSKIVDHMAVFANKLQNKLDAIVFTAGCGENSPLLRKKVIENISFSKIILDEEINQRKIGNLALISAPESKIKVFVIRTNEELVIAQDAKHIFNKTH